MVQLGNDEFILHIRKKANKRGQSSTFDKFSILDTLPQQTWHVGGDR